MLTILAAGTVLAALGIGFQLAGAQYYIYPGIDNPSNASSIHQYTIQDGAISGGNYQVTTLCEGASEGISGGSYRLLNPSSLPWGNCCCNFLPIVRK